MENGLPTGIQASVGLNGTNQFNDVKVIQALLNEARDEVAAFKASTGVLSVDGKCGNITISAIVNYQSKVVHMARPDGRIDPGGATWKKLNGSGQTVADIPVMRAEHSSIDWWRDFFFAPEETYLGKQVQSTYEYFSDLFTWNSDDQENSGTPTATDVVRTYNQAGTPTEFKSYRQGNYKDLLGESGSTTISKTGCLLTSLTMAATVFGRRNQHWPPGLKPVDLTPPKANDIATKSGAFVDGTGILFVERGAKALGMSCEQYGWDRVHGGHIPLTGVDYNKLCAHIDSGRPALAHVDYFKSWKDKKDKDGKTSFHPAGDHWVLITTKINAVFTAIDPAYGKEITLTRDSEASVREREIGKQVGQTRAILWSGAIGTSNNKYYRVVRFGLLDTLGGSDGAQVPTSQAPAPPARNQIPSVSELQSAEALSVSPVDVTTSAANAAVPSPLAPAGTISPTASSTAGIAAGAAVGAGGGAAGIIASKKKVSDGHQFPLKIAPTESYKEGMRAFGANRTNGRKHAGCDLYAPVGTPIYAMDDGEVIRGPYSFYLGTFALEVKHPDFVARYGEISGAAPGIKAGAKVKKGQLLGYVGELTFKSGNKMSMLHLELYRGTASGNLTTSALPYKRRGDLFDPTSILDNAKRA